MQNYLDAAISRQMMALVTSPCDRRKQLRWDGLREMGDEKMGRRGLTTPMMEESNWTSDRRRSSSAFLTRGLESARPSRAAMEEMSMARGARGARGARKELRFWEKAFEALERCVVREGFGGEGGREGASNRGQKFWARAGKEQIFR